jgi:tetratricopeptide (TPR) repeat protein
MMFMKKTTIYTITILLFAVAVVSIVMKYKSDERKKENMVYTLLPRKGAAAQTEEWKYVQTKCSQLLATIKASPGDTKSLVALAGMYVQEARITGNYMYYDKAAMKYVNDALKNNPQDFNALTIKSLLFLSQHHFAEGLEAAEKAQKYNPYNAFVYGLIVDGNVEMGNYTAAVENSDKMVSIRPDIRSYSRISYLREIYGDYAGAIEAMKMAVGAGVPGDEATEWSRIQLGRLYENTGDLENAAMNYTIASESRPGYAYALAGLARVAAAKKEYDKSIALYHQADSLINDFTIKEEMADVYNNAGQKDKALQVAKSVIEGMNAATAGEKKDDSSGHYSDRELAYAYLKVNDYDKALEHALLEYNRRPANIDVNETLGWVYYCKGDYTKALPYMKTALKTNSRNPTLLCRAGLVFSKAGDKGLAKSLLQSALKDNANIAVNLKSESLNILQSL